MPRLRLRLPHWRGSRSSTPLLISTIGTQITGYFLFLYKYIRKRGYRWFSKFELVKDFIVDLLYKRRGKYSRPFLHFGIITLVFVVITFGPLVLDQRRQEQQGQFSSGILQTAYAYGSDLSTTQSEEVSNFRGGEIQVHRVQDGETLSSIASLYNLKVETIMWENNLEKTAKLKPGQELRILPIDGVRHKVSRGETIYSLAKKYGLGEDPADAQRIVNYPFNEYKNSETFELAIGQTLLIPDGVKPTDSTQLQGPVFAVKLTPDAGTVSANGSFIWPAAGRITQGFTGYHPGFDIANRDGGPILAADSGTVIAAGWDTTGYRNRIMVDHANGYITLYGHLSVIQVQPGQRVSRGNVLGKMGSTGHSTGTHLHFEIRRGGVRENPGNYLK